MSAPVHHINQSKFVAVISGACEILVTHRETRNTYQTNRSIKTWATYFLLKSLATKSGLIKDWTAQKEEILSYCKIGENSFRVRLDELQQLKLIILQKNRTIKLTSFETAAGILGIDDYKGEIKIEYNEKIQGKQVFQYYLRAEELRNNQYTQVTTLWYKANKDPQVKERLDFLLVKEIKSDAKLLRKNVSYFQQQFLLLKEKAFSESPTLLAELLQIDLNPEINRSVTTIQAAHHYKSAQSVSYMKNVMRKNKIITVQKIVVESKNRSRLYVPDPFAANNKSSWRDGYKYNPATKKTVWFLCDTIDFTYTSEQPETQLKEHLACHKKVAA